MALTELQVKNAKPTAKPVELRLNPTRVLH